MAEYQPQIGQIYYYTSDQVNSTRVVTDQNGVRVFAAVYDPHGGIQKIWENSYSPAMKFSGKERDTESNLDYFGARYYGNYYYRWLSPDPVINKDAALTNPQLWNLYSFCHNNPVTYWDPDGAVEIIPRFELHYINSSKIIRTSKGRTSGGAFVPDLSFDVDVAKKGKGDWLLLVTIYMSMDIYIPVKGDTVYGRPGLPNDPEDALSHEFGQALLGFVQASKLFAASEALEALKFESKSMASLGASIGKIALTAYNTQIGLEYVAASKLYDLFEIRLVRQGDKKYDILSHIFKTN